MGVLPSYWRDPYCSELATEVVEVGVDERGQPWAVLADTLFYPKAGTAERHRLAE